MTRDEKSAIMQQSMLEINARAEVLITMSKELLEYALDFQDYVETVIAGLSQLPDSDGEQDPNRNEMLLDALRENPILGWRTTFAAQPHGSKTFWAWLGATESILKDLADPGQPGYTLLLSHVDTLIQHLQDYHCSHGVARNWSQEKTSPAAKLVGRRAQ